MKPNQIYKDSHKKYRLSKDKFQRFFPDKNLEKYRLSDLELNVTIIFKNNNEYEVLRTIGPYIKSGSSKLAKLYVSVEDRGLNELDLKMTAKYLGLKFVHWTLIIITLLFTINAVWRILTLEDIERYNLIIPALFTLLISLVIPSIYKLYRLNLIRSFEKYLEINKSS